MDVIGTVAVVTTERRAEYLGDTLRSLAREGMRELESRVIVHVDRTGSTCQAMRNVFRRAAERGGDLLYFEDDVKAARNGVRAMARIGVPEWAGFLAFTSVMHEGEAGVKKRTGRLIGAHALRVPERVVQGLQWPDVELMPQFGSDALLAQLCGVWGQVSPSMFWHVGERSNIDYERSAEKRKWRTVNVYMGDCLDVVSGL